MFENFHIFSCMELYLFLTLWETNKYMGVRPFKKQDKKIHSDVVIIGRARNTRYDYRSRIQLAFAQGRVDWLEKLQQSLFDDMRYCSDADMSFIGMQIKVAQDCIDKIMKQNQKPFEMHVENNYNNFDNMSAEEKAAFIRSLNQGTQIGQQNNIFGGNNTLNYNEKPKEGPQFVDASEVKDHENEDKQMSTPKPLTKDERVKHAIEVIDSEGLLKQKGDLAFVKKAMEEKQIDMCFTLDGFIDYLKELCKKGLDIEVPGKTTISRQLNKIDVKDSDGYYTFNDHCDRNESFRRNGLMKRFLSAYNDDIN